MASTLSNPVFFAALVAVMCLGASAQLSSCATAIISMSPCTNFVTGNDSIPSSSCCSQLASVVKSEPQCLCTGLNAGAAASLGIIVNQTQAMALPGACNVQIPATSRCSSGNSSGTPSPSTPGDGSKRVPAAGIRSSGSFAGVPSLLMFSLLIAVTASLSAPITAF